MHKPRETLYATSVTVLHESDMPTLVGPVSLRFTFSVCGLMNSALWFVHVAVSRDGEEDTTIANPAAAILFISQSDCVSCLP